ncbi:MAG TPA: hypothetical protein VGD56_20855, partial [Gemmatirosa sp.]
LAVARLAVARLAVARLAGARLAPLGALFGPLFGALRVVPFALPAALVFALAGVALEDAPRALLDAAPLRAVGLMPDVVPDVVPFDAEPEAPPFDVPFLPELLRGREPDVVSPEALERVAM